MISKKENNVTDIDFPSNFLIKNYNNYAILTFGSFQVRKLTNKVDVMKFFAEKRTVNYKLIKVSEFIEAWKRECSDEISKFKTYLEKNGTQPRYELIHEWLEQNTISRIVKPYIDLPKASSYISRMESKMSWWIINNYFDVEMETIENPIYDLRGAEKRLLRLMITQNVSSLSDITDEILMKYIKRTRYFIFDNYEWTDVEKAKAFIDKFWDEYK